MWSGAGRSPAGMWSAVLRWNASAVHDWCLGRRCAHVEAGSGVVARCRSAYAAVGPLSSIIGVDTAAVVAEADAAHAHGLPARCH